MLDLDDLAARYSDLSPEERRRRDAAGDLASLLFWASAGRDLAPFADCVGPRGRWLAPPQRRAWAAQRLKIAAPVEARVGELLAILGGAPRHLERDLAAWRNDLEHLRILAKEEPSDFLLDLAAIFQTTAPEGLRTAAAKSLARDLILGGDLPRVTQESNLLALVFLAVRDGGPAASGHKAIPGLGDVPPEDEADAWLRLRSAILRLLTSKHLGEKALVGADLSGAPPLEWSPEAQLDFLMALEGVRGRDLVIFQLLLEGCDSRALARELKIAPAAARQALSRLRRRILEKSSA